MRSGAARPLDFGHWAAHKLEQLSEFQIRHGEAVAIGMALDVIYSRNIGLLDAAAASGSWPCCAGWASGCSPTNCCILTSAHQPVILKGLEDFREHLGGQLTLTLLKGIGQGVEVHEIVLPRMLDAIHELQQQEAPPRNGASCGCGDR